MLTRDVHYSEQPDRVLITRFGKLATIEFPLNVHEEYKTFDGEEIVEYVADEVYSFTTLASSTLEERINSNYEAWLEKAKEPEPKDTTISDIVEVIAALTDMIIGE